MNKYKKRSRSRQNRSRSNSYDHKHKRRNRSSNSQDRSRSESPKQSKYKIQQTKTLSIQGIYASLSQIQRVLTDISIIAGTSVPDQVEVKDNCAYIKYPSIEVSSLVYNHLNGQIEINGKYFQVNFYPVKKIDLSMSYDWYCDKCDYQNFARRNKCYRCQNQKNPNCKFNFSTQGQVIYPKYPKQENSVNCSIMIRGSVIMDTQQQILLQLFQSIAPVKDIRMIKNKMTGKYKDFAFVQFYSPEQTSSALKAASAPQFRVKGEKVTVMYSRNKSQDDFVKPLPYERKDRRKQPPKKDGKTQITDNYYKRQRQLEIQQEKQRPLITLEQLKEKRQLQMKKNAPIARQMTSEQNKRRQAQLQAKLLQKQLKIQNSVMYICPLCIRKFKGQQQMKAHETFSQYHKYNLNKIQKTQI